MKIAALKASADLTRTWLHIDMDAFFASVEELDDPSLVGLPALPGAHGMWCRPLATYALIQAALSQLHSRAPSQSHQILHAMISAMVWACRRTSPWLLAALA